MHLSYEFRFGWDTLAPDNNHWGVNAGFSKTVVDGDNAGDNKNTIDSYRVGLYGDIDLNPYYLDWQVSYAYNDIQPTRKIQFAGLNRQAQGKTHGAEWGFRLAAGKMIPVGKQQQLTPNLSFHYVQSHTQSFTETGANAFNLHVEDNQITIAEISAGIQYSAIWQHSGYHLKPEFRIAAGYDLAADQAISEQTFVGGGSTFKIKGAKVTRSSALLGTWLSVTSNNKQWTFSADYDARIKTDYLSHGARVELKYQF